MSRGIRRDTGRKAAPKKSQGTSQNSTWTEKSGTITHPSDSKAPAIIRIDSNPYPKKYK